ncbi:MAG TPA: sigma-70 family RNA polymerase sigma factor [Chloroflexota bacterium]|nr:sigma-70 family RNA polymerase sigma factor [Chloroflexota bacterium]
MVDDRALLEQIARGDTAALGFLYDRYAALAFGLAMRILRDPGVAEEVVQDAFLAAWRRSASYRPDRGEPRTWFLSIVHHRAIDRVRGAAGQRAEVDLADLPELVDRADVWRETRAGLEREAILAALTGLPEEQRVAIELAFFGGLTHAEIAERLGEPLGTIKGRMRLGLLKLRTVLQGQEVA